jgi:hypothetical protein
MTDQSPNPKTPNQNPPEPETLPPANKVPGEPNPKESPSHPQKTVEEKQAEIEEEHRRDAQKKVQDVHDDIMKAKTPEDHRRLELLKEIGEHLKAFGDESNIPVPHKYWDLTNEYRGIGK